MTCWAIIPIKGRGDGKTRLAGTLSTGEREALVDAMLAHVVEAVRQTRSIDRLCLVGPSRRGLDESLPLLPDAGSGLNAALESALAQVARDGPGRLVVIPGDLPCVTSRDLDLLANVTQGTVGIAPDRHGTGTNGLSLPLPQASSFTFHFGLGSCGRHHDEARRLGLPVKIVRSEGLAKDIDEPADLTDATQVFSPGGDSKP